MKINILTQGFSTPNGAAFLFPLIKHRLFLDRQGIHLRFFKKIEDMQDADVIMVDSKYFTTQWRHNTEGIIETFCQFKKKSNRLLYFDISDSSSWPQARILPYVDAYVKNQLLVDKTAYLRPLYGHRLYTDYYHQQNKVIDNPAHYSEPVQDLDLLKKLMVGWNSGLADYSMNGPYRMMLYDKFSWKGLLSFPRRYVKPALDRPLGLSCRMGMRYARDTVSWQRRQIYERLEKRILMGKISRKKYYRELMQSKLVISPFGLGEITLKDFEVFLTGGLLLKPDLSHMTTWPNFYQNNRTIVTCRWDLSDLESVVDHILSHYTDYVEIAQTGQANYREYLVGEKAAELFYEHLNAICTEKLINRCS